MDRQQAMAKAQALMAPGVQAQQVLAAKREQRFGRQRRQQRAAGLLLALMGSMLALSGGNGLLLAVLAGVLLGMFAVGRAGRSR